MSISVHTAFYEGRDASEPGIVVQVTVLHGSYMIWAGTSAVSEEDKEKAILTGHLGRDWACGMPPTENGNSTGTVLLRSSGSDAALSMACRLAKRLRSQVFVALDVESRLVMLAERRIIASL
ncbi:hypothetical protein DFH07DRAFT_953016 [Mycena maculata]|uniref:Uncharacterized protein n=1 Tax=Mycena maculata TaxID=230809 RepID=A0AAD7NSA0_9AGAR|nr:hypothetical protein DFH07DRAFT_953016 [Mycena maculata]